MVTCDGPRQRCASTSLSRFALCSCQRCIPCSDVHLHAEGTPMRRFVTLFRSRYRRCATRFFWRIVSTASRAFASSSHAAARAGRMLCCKASGCASCFTSCPVALWRVQGCWRMPSASRISWRNGQHGTRQSCLITRHHTEYHNARAGRCTTAAATAHLRRRWTVVAAARVCIIQQQRCAVERRRADGWSSAVAVDAQLPAGGPCLLLRLRVGACGLRAPGRLAAAAGLEPRGCRRAGRREHGRWGLRVRQQLLHHHLLTDLKAVRTSCQASLGA